MRRGPAAVQHPGLGEGERAAAEADQAGTAGVRPADGLEHGGAARDLGVGPVGHDQGVGGLGGVQIRRRR